jgi:hypothetical protein
MHPAIDGGTIGGICESEHSQGFRNAREMDKLSAVEIKAAQPHSIARKLSDGGGLYVLVQPDGAKYWRLKYRFAQVEKKLALGVYPEVSLSEARKGRGRNSTLMLPNGTCQRTA